MAKTYSVQICLKNRASCEREHLLISLSLILFFFPTLAAACRIEVVGLCVFVWIQAHSLTERLHDIDLLSLDAQSVAEVVQ